MLETTVIRTRLDKKTKEASEAVLQEIGMTPHEAIRLFCRQIAIRKEFPLELRAPNALTTKTLDESAGNQGVEYLKDKEALMKSWLE